MTEIRTEKEVTLVICSEERAIVAEQICQLKEIGHFRAQFVGNLLIKDSYFDTPAGDLKSRGWALRLRQTDKESLITLKGPSRTSDSGLMERLEIETAYSSAAFERILAEIENAGFNLPAHETAKLPDPFREIEAAGFQLIQARETLRRLMNIFQSSQAQRVAEMAVDHVIYRFESGSIDHYEVEVESKSETGADAAKAMVTQLKTRFGTELRVWPHSKLATGWALEQLVRDEASSIEAMTLNDAIYDKIDAMLKIRPLRQ